MSIILEPGKIPGLFIVRPHIFTDHRGKYIKYYESDVFKESDIYDTFSEESQIISDKGVMRGLHIQSKCPQSKLVRVIKGRAFDVAVDLRPDSKTLGQWQGFTLEENGFAVFIPAGFAHGFMSLEDNTIFVYSSGGVYKPEYNVGIAWDDPILSINWPLEKEEITLSEKDSSNESFVKYLDLKV